ncbi:RagB/SusD family nutrient uptake outer membrane protein [Sphingobacterium sp. SYP-B4668]|uniref:RagB/SusD family nutrient uptake outer membrane protein n=1 Tax=Sphingobacterium sp. SYP-B4668 TaxID=2996035 RepID=UPI0022DD8063|nr:RagB/SusD family nutrient uptake outer membrane protein [Sphingobacterium sp. SYP-B4668]
MKYQGIKTIIYIFLTASLFTISSCGKEFLNLTPIDDLSGNNYWKRERDVNQYVQGIYNTFRDATMQMMFFPASGDLRCAPINRTSATSGAGRDYISHVMNNNLNAAIYGDFSYFGFDKITRWNLFYKMAQSANILYYEVGQMESSILSDRQRDAYRAEAVFLRNLAYFFMVRLYGDIPYYTEAYQSSPLPRTNMIQVLKNGLADMEQHYKNLPWTYDDPSIVAVRAMRGAGITLMMHMNMWIAGFTTEDKIPYYEKVAELGGEILTNGGAYELLPLERTKEIFKGRTKEGLFEIVQNLNFGETFHLSATFADYVLRAPNKVTTRSYIYYDTKFMETLYPRGEQDKRKTVWFDEYIYNTDGMMQMLKFVNVFMEEGEDYNPDDNQIVFRYADPILLRAEALAELNREDEAREAVNMIRRRAGAKLAQTETGEELKDFIWWERVRELMGEGHFYYDLVRTKKVVNSDYTSRPMNVVAFNSGGWTWPIHKDALLNNPFMTLNNFWN